jgi:hypothetical protein
MKRKIILLVLCAVLLLMFTSSSYGGFDPNYMEREQADPWERFTSPSSDGEPLVGVRFVGVTPHLILVVGIARIPTDADNAINVCKDSKLPSTENSDGRKKR